MLRNLLFLLVPLFFISCKGEIGKEGQVNQSKVVLTNLSEKEADPKCKNSLFDPINRDSYCFDEIIPIKAMGIEWFEQYINGLNIIYANQVVYNLNGSSNLQLSQQFFIGETQYKKYASRFESDPCLPARLSETLLLTIAFNVNGKIYPVKSSIIYRINDRWYITFLSRGEKNEKLVTTYFFKNGPNFIESTKIPIYEKCRISI